MNVLIVMPSRVQRTTSRSVSSKVRRVGGYENRGMGLPGSKCAVGSPSVIRMICLFLPRERESRVRAVSRSEEHTSELQSRSDLVCRLLLEKKKKRTRQH